MGLPPLIGLGVEQHQSHNSLSDLVHDLNIQILFSFFSLEPKDLIHLWKTLQPEPTDIRSAFLNGGAEVSKLSVPGLALLIPRAHWLSSQEVFDLCLVKIERSILVSVKHLARTVPHKLVTGHMHDIDALGFLIEYVSLLLSHILHVGLVSFGHGVVQIHILEAFNLSNIVVVGDINA